MIQNSDVLAILGQLNRVIVSLIKPIIFFSKLIDAQLKFAVSAVRNDMCLHNSEILNTLYAVPSMEKCSMTDINRNL